jgi:hypothetical protein
MSVHEALARVIRAIEALDDGDTDLALEILHEIEREMHDEDIA